MHTSRLREFMAKNCGLLSRFVIRTLVVMPQINVSDLHITSAGLGSEDTKVTGRQYAKSLMVQTLAVRSATTERFWIGDGFTIIRVFGTSACIGSCFLRLVGQIFHVCCSDRCFHRASDDHSYFY
jgi:hypothetical protein